MSHHRLRGVGNNRGLIYVGGAVAEHTGSGDITLSLTSLTGGIASSPAAGDVVIVAFASKAPENYNLTMATSGYTELADLYSNDTRDAALGVYAKVMGATPDTSASATNPYAFTEYGIAAHVWRNTNVVSGIVTPIATATGVDSGVPNPPAVTPTVAGSVIIVVGAGTAIDTEQPIFSAPSGITLFQGNPPYNINIAIGAYVGWTSGAYDCAAFGGGSTSIADSWCAASLVLQPV